MKIKKKSLVKTNLSNIIHDLLAKDYRNFIPYINEEIWYN